MNKNINIIMVEDHPEYREIVEMAISRQDGMELTEQFGTAERALEHLRHLDEHNDMPDVILLDLNLPGMDGLEALELLATEAPATRIVALTQSDHEEDILKAVSLGASGYLLKSSTVQQLIESIKHVMQGGASLDARIAGFVMGELKARLPHQELEKMLTAREIEILSLMAEGLVKKQISEKLGISVTTVISHVGNIYEKLEASNAPSAIAKGFKLGILKLDD
ncbi:MAG: response regulator [Akkermansiaceae bacterium]